MSTNLSIGLHRLIERAVRNALFRARQLGQPGDYDLVELSRQAHALVLAAKDLRTLATSIAHGVSDPRPDLGALAAGQFVSPSGIRRRYPEAIVRPLAQLNAGDPIDATALIDGLESLTAADMLGVNAQLDYSIESTFGPQTPGPIVREEIDRRRIEDIEPLSQILRDGWVRIDPEPAGDLIPSFVADSFRIIGEINHELSLRSFFRDYRCWTAAGGRSVTFEWIGGPTIDQFLGIVMPLIGEDGSPSHGVRGLQLDDYNAATTMLKWVDGDRRIGVKLERL